MEATQRKRVNQSFESLWTAETLLNLAQRRVQETAEQAKLLRKKMKAAKKEFKQAKKTARLAKKKLAAARKSFDKTKVRIEKKVAQGHSMGPKMKVKKAGVSTKTVAAQRKVRKPAFPKPAVQPAGPVVLAVESGTAATPTSGKTGVAFLTNS